MAKKFSLHFLPNVFVILSKIHDWCNVGIKEKSMQIHYYIIWDMTRQLHIV